VQSPVIIETSIPLIDDILGEWAAVIGPDYEGYRHHVYRVVHFGLALHPCRAEERRQVIVAACFHDLGIWSDRTVDYLSPSEARAREYLARQGLGAWEDEIVLMIETHHKLRRYRDPRHPLVEAFRRADLVDVSLGLVRSGLERRYIGDVRRAFPNAGFHWRLVRLLLDGLTTRPLSPTPFFKW
jgi:hypothetical protein